MGNQNRDITLKKICLSFISPRHPRHGDVEGGEDTVLLKTYFNLPLEGMLLRGQGKRIQGAGNRGVWSKLQRSSIAKTCV